MTNNNPLIILSFILLLFSTSTNAQKIFDLMEKDGVNLKEAQNEAAAYFAKVGTGKGTGYKLFKRWEHHAILNLQADGTILSNKTHAAAIKSSKKAASLGAKTISPSNWKELGPLAMTTGDGGFSPGIGRITAIYVEPVNQQLIYVGSPGGGLWKSINGGSSWTPLGDQFDNMNILSIQADPNNTDIVYVGNSTGELHKSTDGGFSFTTTPLLDTNGALRAILINPNNTNEIFTALVNNGVYHTTNGGDDWTKVINADIEDLHYKPGSTTTIYACGDDFYRSTDSGTSFTKVTSGILISNRMKLAVSPANSNYVYIVQKSNASGFGYLYRSTNSGASFTAQSIRSDVDYIGKQAWRDMAIAISDTDANEVHIGGLNLYKSIDGGVSFERKTAAATYIAANLDLEYVHADTEVLQYINGNLYVGCDGGIFKSTNAAATFTDLSVGLGVQQFYRIANSATNKNVVAGGTQDNGCTVKSDVSLQWMQFLGNDGMDCMIDPNDENIIYACNQYGRFLKTIDRGASFLTQGLMSKPPENSQGRWITPIAMDANNSRRVYAGYAELYRHDNAAELGSAWVNTSSTIDFDAKLAHIELCPSNSDVIYVSTLYGFYKSSNITTASPTWTTLAPPITNGGIINDIAVDPYDENRVALATSGGFILLSTNGGASWTRIENGIPTTSIKTIVFDRSPDQGMYAAINGAVYYKSNSVTNWTVFSNKLPNVSIMELELYYDQEVQEDSRIRVATYGRGLWESPLYDDEDAEGSGCSAIGNAYATIEAEDFCDQKGIKTSNNGAAIGYIQHGDYIGFNTIAFGSNGASNFEAIVSSNRSGGTIEIRLDSPTGALVGTCSVSNTGGWTKWVNASCAVSGVTGDHDVYLVFTGGSGYLLDINSFEFSEESSCSSIGTAYITIEAEDFCNQKGIKTGNNGTTIGYIQHGDYIGFKNIAFGSNGASNFEAVVSSNTSGGTIEIHLDGPTGALIGTCSVGNTGGWTKWTNASCAISGATGDHDVYLVFTGGSRYLLDINSFKFTEKDAIFPDPTKKYYIDAPHHNYRIAATGESEAPYITTTTATGADVEWKFVAKGNGYWHIDRAAGGTKPRLRTDNSENADMQETSYSAGWTYYDISPGYIENTYYLTLPDSKTNFHRLQVQPNKSIKMVTTASAGTWESFRITEVPASSAVLEKTIEEELNQVIVFPNPVSTTMHIQLPTDGEKTGITISNVLGQVILQHTFDTHEGLNLLKMNIEEFPAGLYNVTILRGQTKRIKNIIIEK